MAMGKEVFQSVTTYKLVLRKMAMIFPKYDHVFELPKADYGRQMMEDTKSADIDEIRELDYGRIPLDTVSKSRTVLSSVKVIAFALSAIVIAIVFESRLHIF